MTHGIGVGLLFWEGKSGPLQAIGNVLWNAYCRYCISQHLAEASLDLTTVDRSEHPYSYHPLCLFVTPFTLKHCFGSTRC